ncbi:MAG: 3-alpha-hydroxysteroid dehydrogenase [Ilumatobacteraceae bacterium]|nr:3-alpha-hydroxysteroid dehydrogenase [Ilumatobacteraceae bacterium]
MNTLTGRIAVITGGARGMGASHARRFVAEGASVVITDVGDAGGLALAAELGEAAHFVHHDVSSEDDWANVITTTVKHFGGLDILVNNAGIHWVRPLEDETVAAFRQAFEVNLLGTFLGIRSAVAPMRSRGGGSIINVSSLAGTTGQGWHAAYGASKWGVRGLSRVAANELGHDGIRVNTVLPGAIETDMLPPDRGGLGSNRFAHLPLGRSGLPAEISSLVLFLASDESSYISGGEFAIDGGSSSGPPLTPRPSAPA